MAGFRDCLPCAGAMPPVARRRLPTLDDAASRCAGPQREVMRSPTAAWPGTPLGRLQPINEWAGQTIGLLCRDSNSADLFPRANHRNRRARRRCRRSPPTVEAEVSVLFAFGYQPRLAGRRRAIVGPPAYASSACVATSTPQNDEERKDSSRASPRRRASRSNSTMTRSSSGIGSYMGTCRVISASNLAKKK
jgi:hypothetical protein